VFLALGGNLGDVRAAFDAALARLPRLGLAKVGGVAPLYRTAPIGPEDQPDYLNTVAVLTPMVAPTALLAGLHQIERDSGRDRATERRWGPRPLDLDLLAWGTLVEPVGPPRLPHPRLADRFFVLVPWADLARGYTVPEHDRTVASLLDALCRRDPEGLALVRPA
jgi:2-amino-4-hydroxy-6-hydroxymethyldihydropteridine diphosphokinase